MQKEMEDQFKHGNFTIMKRSKIPKNTTVLPAVWQMSRKHDIISCRILKYKAHLSIDESRMKNDIHYEETYAPVASWKSVRILTTLATALSWHTVQLNYVLAYPREPVERELYIKNSVGINVSKGNPKEFVLNVNQNVYGQKRAGRVWNKYLVNILVNKLKFKQSKIDESTLR